MLDGFRAWRPHETPHFSVAEMRCPCCAVCDMDARFMVWLENLRVKFGRPMIVNSGFRCTRHNAAVGGGPNSAHLHGWAVDIEASFEYAHALIGAALAMGARGLGVAQKGGDRERYLHLDMMVGGGIMPRRPTVWSY